MDEYFDRLIELAGFTPRTLAHWFKVSPRTIQRWRQHGAPVIALRALELRAGYDCQWRGFRFIGRNVITPAGESLDRSRVEMHHWLIDSARDVARHQERERLTVELDAKWRRYFDLAFSTSKTEGRCPSPRTRRREARELGPLR